MYKLYTPLFILGLVFLLSMAALDELILFLLEFLAFICSRCIKPWSWKGVCPHYLQHDRHE